MANVDPAAVVARFNESINRRDGAGLAGLMSDDHVFVDSAGGVVAGKEECLAAWRGFFAAFPDYRNVFESMVASGEVVVIVGHSVCAEPSLAGLALWRATVREGRVAEWRVFEGTPEIRERLGVPAA